MTHLFIRIPKCASSFLVNIFGEKIIYTNARTWLTEEENKQILRQNKTSFKFTIVRNPYDRSYSCWKYGMKAKLLPVDLSFENFLKCDLYNDYNLSVHAKTHSVPLSDYIGDHLKILNYIAKVETLHKDITYISDILGYKDQIDFTPFYTTGYSSNEKEKMLNSLKIIDLINKKYESDFMNFNYEMK